MKKALVIGGSGFAGRHLIDGLLKEGCEVYAIEHKAQIPGNLNVRVIKGGISAVDSHLIRSIQPDYIFHYARPKLPYLRKAGRLMAARYASWQNKRLIRELENPGHQSKLIFASGSLMYGSSPSPLDEDSPIHPVSFASQYHRGEIPILNAEKSGKIPVMVMRFPWLLGRGSWFEWFYLRTMEKSSTVPLFGNGDNKMEVLDIRDATKMVMRYAFENEGSGIFNLVSAKAITQLEFASAISSVSGMPVRDYREVFHGHLEKEALQAFSSNIVLATKYPHLQKDQHYTPLEETLAGILSEYGLH